MASDQSYVYLFLCACHQWSWGITGWDSNCLSPGKTIKIGWRLNVRKRPCRNLHCLESHPHGIFRDDIKEQYYPIGRYEDKYTRWATLWRERDQTVPEFKNTFHTLHTKMGIKEYEWHWELKCCGCIHRYIQIEIKSLDISSLVATYQYVVKIEQKCKHKKKDFRYVNPSHWNQAKGIPKS